MDGFSTRIQEDERVKGEIESIAQEVGLKQSAPLMYDVDCTFDEVDISKRNSYAFNSQALWQKNEYFRSQKIFIVDIRIWIDGAYHVIVINQYFPKYIDFYAYAKKRVRSLSVDRNVSERSEKDVIHRGRIFMGLSGV